MPVIDVHGHVGVLETPQDHLPPPWMWGDAARVESLAREAGIDEVFVSSLWSCSRYDPASEQEARTAAEGSRRIRFWAVVDPRIPESFDAAHTALAHPKCVGVKLHPVWQHYDLRHHLDQVMDFAEAHRAVVLTHTEAGQAGVDPLVCADAANRHPQARLVMAHLGFGEPPRRFRVFDQMLAVRQARHDNLFVDTASQHMIFEGFLEEVVRRFSPEHILFGTDLPLHSAGAILARVRTAAIPDAAREAILFRNAQRIWPALEAVSC